MKFIKNFNLFNEGLFSDYTTDDDIAKAIYKIVDFRRDYIPVLENEELVIHDIKLDDNPGTYNVYSSKERLCVKYYKKETLLFTKELECADYLKETIYRVIEKAYKRNNII